MAPALDVACPMCSAAPNEPCRNQLDGGRRLITGLTHFSRALAAAEGDNAK